MLSFTFFFAVFVSFVAAYIVPRAPGNWSNSLEPHSTFYERYIELECDYEDSNSPFFNTCCYPLKASQTTAELCSRDDNYADDASFSASADTCNGNNGNGNGNDGNDDGNDDNGDGNNGDGDDNCDCNDADPDPNCGCDDDDVSSDDDGDDCECDDEDDDCEPSQAPSNTHRHAPTGIPTTPPSTQSTPTTCNDDDSNCEPSRVPTPTHTKGTPTTTQPSGGGGKCISPTYTNGYGTYFYQKGQPGACGTVHPDTAIICAMDSAIYNIGICAREVKITWNGITEIVQIEDDCPTCNNNNSIDLSVAAFEKFAPTATGLLPGIEWCYVS